MTTVEPAPLRLLVPLVAAGGALGGLARWTLTSTFPDVPATFGINVAGAFLLGLLVARRPEGHWSRTFLGTGVLGGFTTMSALAVDTLQEPAATGVAYVVLSMGAGLAAAALGLRCRP